MREALSFGVWGVIALIVLTLIGLWCATRRDLSSTGIYGLFGRYWVGWGLHWPPLRWIPAVMGGSDGLPAQGSYLLMANNVSDESPDSFTEISEVTNISGGGGTTERIDFTHLRSPGNRREYKPSFIDSGVLSFTCQYIPTDTSHQTLLARLDSQVEFVMREVFPDGNGWDYYGYIESIEKTGQDVGGKLQLNVTYKINGVIDFSGGGSPV